MEDVVLTIHLLLLSLLNLLPIALDLSPLTAVRIFGTKSGVNKERVWLFWLVSLCGALFVMQATRFECLSFDPFSLL